MPAGGQKHLARIVFMPTVGNPLLRAMETDFYITVNVKNLNDDKELGTWIINVMKIIDALPSGSISGPQAGFR